MKSIAITLPDGSKRTYEGTVTPLKVAREIGKRLEEAAIAAIIGGVEADLTHPIQNDCKLHAYSGIIFLFDI